MSILMNTNNKKRVLVVALLASVIFTVDAPRAHAGYWGESIFAAIMQNTLQNIKKQIEGALLGTLKVAAVQLLNNQVLQAVDGSTGQSSIITDFEQFLNTVPEKEADRVIISEFLSQSLRGKDAIANYIDANQSAPGVRGNYNAYLKEAVLNATVNKQDIPKNTFAECSTGGSDPRKAIPEGDFRAVSCLFESPANNPMGIALSAQEKYQLTLEEKKKEQEVIAQSSGVKPLTDKDGNIITPAGTVGNLINDVTTLGNKLIVGANNPAEFLSGVVVSVVNRTVSKVIRQGTGEIQRTISREIGNINRQTDKAIYDAEGILGPAGGILDTRLNQTKTNTGGAPTVPQPVGSAQGKTGN